MKANFGTSLAAVLVHEGGFVNHPRDPGGATNRGVTQAVYDDWRVGRKLAPRSVKFISPVEVEEIYRRRYWDSVRGDDLPAGVDYCVFDLAVNSGTNRAARFLQQAVGVADDGQIGPVTVAAVKAKPASETIDLVCDLRLAFLKRLSTFDAFGKGWTRRIEDVLAKSRALA